MALLIVYKLIHVENWDMVYSIIIVSSELIYLFWTIINLANQHNRI